MQNTVLFSEFETINAYSNAGYEAVQGQWAKRKQYISDAFITRWLLSWPKTPTHRIVRNRPYIGVKCKTNAKQICRQQNQYLIQHRYLMCNLRQNFICFYSDRIKLNRIRSTAEGQLTIVVCKLVIFNGFARVDLIKTIAVRLQRIAVARLLAARFHDVSAEEVLKQFRRRASVSRLQRTPLTVHVLDEVAAVIA